MTARVAGARQVAGLHVHEWPAGGPVVVGLPGLGSTGMAFAALAQALPDVRVVAPDLRGRGRSAGVTGPIGLRAHAHDVARIADELELRDIVVVGHSMGAYLAPIAAQELGDRVARLVLVDGGVRPKLPLPFRSAAVVRFVFRTQIRKADRTYPDPETFVRKAVGRSLENRPDLFPAVVAMMGDELDGPPGTLKPRLNAAHAIADAVDSFHGDDVVQALDTLRVPAHLLAASGQKRDGGKPFIADEVIEQWTRRQPLLTAERVEANHITILFMAELARAVAG